MAVKKKAVKKKTTTKKVSNRKPISKKGARSKGHNFERKIANELVDIFPDVRRQLEYHAADANGADLQNTGRFKFQCKKYKAYVSISTIKEVKFNPRKKEVPVLVTAGDNQPPMVALKWSDFKEMLKCVVGTETQNKPKKTIKAVEHVGVGEPIDVGAIEATIFKSINEQELKEELETLNFDMLIGISSFSNITIKELFERLEVLQGIEFNNSNTQKVAKVLKQVGFKQKKINGQNAWAAF